MHIVLLIPEYILWHYSRALRLTLNIITNFIWFTYNFFSIPILVKTFFAPWYIVQETYRPGFHPVLRAENIILQTVMDVVGPVIRLIAIVFGLTICVVTGFVGLAMFVIWFLLPFIVVYLIGEGFYLLFS